MDSLSHFVTAPDGLRLHVRAYGRAPRRRRRSRLPGPARSSGATHALATVLAGDAERPRRVIAIDYQPRPSDYDRMRTTTASPSSWPISLPSSRHSKSYRRCSWAAARRHLAMLLAAVRPTAWPASSSTTSGR
jgi:hypothetical protein